MAAPPSGVLRCGSGSGCHQNRPRTATPICLGRLRAFVDRYGRFPRVDGHDLDRAEDWFDSKSGTAVLIGRCVPRLRADRHTDEVSSGRPR
jgi:hypothetical protein